jgi:hypothetical protein
MSTPPARVPVDPAVHVEQYPTHGSFTWRVPDLARTLDAVHAVDGVSARTSAVVDATNAAGRRQVPLSAVDPGPATTYVRVEPSAPWTVAWERRSSSVCILTGTPPASTVRALHRATGGTGWDADAAALVARALP